ncbi:MAG: MarR family transcriptional regulator [Candidatus Bathyarchaeota archaeon]|nr:MarR family transcriptional regulator [Candidatus Bathyarchaeota archaeon]
MSNNRLTVCLTICTLLLMLLPLHAVQAQNYFEYNVQIKSDGSAVWMITQFSSANATVDTWDAFQQKVFDLLNSAVSVTHREMSVDENSLQINSAISPESKTTEYTFVWQNFSIVQDGKISFGDVFQVTNFFGQLYGDASLQLSYPSDFKVKSVSPAPYERQDSADTLRWSRTQDLVTNQVSVVLVSNSQNGNSPSGDWQLYGGIIAVLAVVAAFSLFGFFRVKRRRTKASSTNVVGSLLLSEEEKILKLLKSSGGSMRQSKITEQSRFSKAKTSQLLTALEKNGSITRYKNGRDKIVTLKERVKGE